MIKRVKAYLPRQYDPLRCVYSYGSHRQTLATDVQSSTYKKERFRDRKQTPKLHHIILQDF